VRLLTLTGPGGTGKTRLALELAASVLDKFDGGVFFVDLAPVGDARLVLSTISRTVGLRDSGTRPHSERLARYIADRHVLLVIDNFEQVPDAAPTLSQLLADCSNLKMLVTSRARLRLRWEHVLPVPPLDVPDPRRLPSLEILTQIPSVALFLYHARAIDPAFSLTQANARALAELCVRVDGLPLALELAAARVNALQLQQILAHPLEFLKADVVDISPRHQTMRRAIGWSYDLLSPTEQSLFRQISIFPSGSQPDGAAAVWADEPGADGRPSPLHDVAGQVLERLASLANRSLLRVTRQVDGELRLSMLETIRAFGLEQLAEGGELDSTSRRFRDFFLALAERVEPHLTGPDQGVWMDRLEREHDNIAAAIRWCVEHGEAEEGLRLAGALWRFWFTRGHLSEGDLLLGELLSLTFAPAEPRTRAKALNAAGNLAHARGDLDRAARLHEESLTLRRELGDRQGIAISLNSLANVAVEREDHETARALYEQSLALRRDVGDERGIAVTLNNLSVVARDERDWQRAAALSMESSALFRDLGDKQGVALSLVTLGVARYHLGFRTEAMQLHRESIALFSELENKREIAEWLQVLALIACTHRQPTEAAQLFGAADSAFEELGSTMRPGTNPRYRRHVAEVRETLGEAAFASAWAEGFAMTLEDAMAEALALVQPGSGQHNPRLSRFEPASEPPVIAASSRPRSRRVGAPGLTRREQEVVALLARGLTNREIAAELTIGERTAESHVSRILAKLNLTRRAQLTAWAVQHDLQRVRPA